MARDFGTRSLPPMPSIRYPDPQPHPEKPSLTGLLWAIAIVVGIFLIGFGLAYILL